MIYGKYKKYTAFIIFSLVYFKDGYLSSRHSDESFYSIYPSLHGHDLVYSS